MKKLPPIEKIPEAWSALADGRVHLLPDEHLAEVRSSDGSKTYTIGWQPGPDGADVYTSNDNSTYWQLYPGYPVLAVMMLRGQLPYDRAMADQWRGINWNALNLHHRRNYARAVAEVVAERGLNPEAVGAAEAQVMDALAACPATVRRSSLRPPA